MKNLIALVIVALFTTGAMAQQVDLRKKITVSGSAEKEVTPDIIYISISLEEYLKDGNSKKKVEITTLENQLVNAVQASGIPKENLTINNLSSYNYSTTKKKDPDFLASKQYRLKVSDLNKFNAIMDAIDPKGIAYTNIESYDHSKMEEFKKELKVKALQAAKAKALYMVTALGNDLGAVLDIQEVGNESFPQQNYRSNAMMVRSESLAASDAAAEIDFKTIKLTSVVNTVFEIK
jgi:uncharacterized protein YggE